MSRIAGAPPPAQRMRQAIIRVTYLRKWVLAVSNQALVKPIQRLEPVAGRFLASRLTGCEAGTIHDIVDGIVPLAKSGDLARRGYDEFQ